MRLGLLVNPVAGMGGRVGLKGTDGADRLAEAIRRGATPQAGVRAVRALATARAALGNAADRLAIFAAPGAMGETAALAAGFAPTIVGTLPLGTVAAAGDIPGASPTADTSAAHTRRAAAALKAEGVDLLLFAGGDGTARDILAALEAAPGEAPPLLGIPTGVKMMSAVFATTPEAAGRLVARLAATPARVSVRPAEVMDMVDIAGPATADGRVATRLFGYARAPVERLLVQSAKASGPADDPAALDAAAREIVAGMARDRTYVVGPGTSAKRVLAAMGHAGTLLGFDAVRDGTLVRVDLTERDLLALAAAGPVTIVLGVVGGQGCLIGRGNVQLSPAVLAAIGPDNLIVLADAGKLTALGAAGLFVDTGDPATDAALAGYRRVRIGSGRDMIIRVR